MISESDERLFERLMHLINTDMQAAVIQSRNLTEEQKVNFQSFLANRTLHSESARYRGRVIEMSIYLEMIIANVLSNYFGKEDKISLLNSMIFDRMDLQRKLNTFKSILKNQHPAIWRKENTAIKKIDKLIAFRNNLAHSMLNSTSEYTNKLKEKMDSMTEQGKIVEKMEEIEFGFYENHQFVFKPITWEEVNAYHKGIMDALKKIEEIAHQIIKDYK